MKISPKLMAKKIANNNQNKEKSSREERIMILAKEIIDILKSINKRNKMFLLETESWFKERKQS